MIASTFHAINRWLSLWPWQFWPWQFWPWQFWPSQFLISLELHIVGEGRLNGYNNTPAMISTTRSALLPKTILGHRIKSINCWHRKLTLSIGQSSVMHIIHFYIKPFTKTGSQNYMKPLNLTRRFLLLFTGQTSLQTHFATTIIYGWPNLSNRKITIKIGFGVGRIIKSHASNLSLNGRQIIV